MTPDNHIREALTMTPHSETYKEVRFLLHQALHAYKEAQAVDPRIVMMPKTELSPQQKLLEELKEEEDSCEFDPTPKKTKDLLKEFGW